MNFFKILGKLLLSLAYDSIDFFLGRIPGVGTIFDILGGFFGLWLWGIPGALQFLEVIDITDQIDGFIPTMTLAGIISLLTKGE